MNFKCVSGLFTINAFFLMKRKKTFVFIKKNYIFFMYFRKIRIFALEYIK